MCLWVVMREGERWGFQGDGVPPVPTLMDWPLALEGTGWAEVEGAVSRKVERGSEPCQQHRVGERRRLPGWGA